MGWFCPIVLTMTIGAWVLLEKWQWSNDLFGVNFVKCISLNLPMSAVIEGSDPMKTSHFAVCVNIALLSLTLTACGNNAERDKPTPQPTPNPLEETLEAGALTLEGMDDNALNPADTVLKFAIKTTTFDATASEVRLSVNGKPVDAAKISVGANQINAAVLLDDGRNDIVFKAYDMAGRPVFLNKTVWAGKNKLAVAVVSADGTPVPDGTTVTLRLSDNLDIGATAKTIAGAVEFLHVPARTVVAEARTADNGTGVVGGAGGNGTLPP